MPTTSEEPARFRQQMHRIESLLQEAERSGDPASRARTREIVQLLMEVHASALDRLLESVADAGPAGVETIERAAADDQVASLLLLHGLHPAPLEARVRDALEKVRPYLHSHGGNVELLGVESGVVRLRLQGSCHGCPSSAMTLKTSIEEAIFEKAPDVAGIEVEGEIAGAAGETSALGESPPGRFALPILSA